MAKINKKIMITPSEILPPKSATEISVMTELSSDPVDAGFLVERTISVPEPPTYPSERGTMALHDEQQVARVEIMMTKGVRSKAALMAALDVVDPRQMDRYVARVLARWEQYGSSRDFTRMRGASLTRLDLIESELWVKVGNNADSRVAVAALKTILDLDQYRTSLVGLTPKMIERMADLAGEESVTFTKRVATHEMLSRVAAKMLEKIEQRMRRNPEPEAEVDEIP